MDEQLSLKVKISIFAVLTVGIVATVFWVLDDLQSYEAWAGLMFNAVTWFLGFMLLTNDLLDRKYRKGQARPTNTVGPLYQVMPAETGGHGAKSLAVAAHPWLHPFVYLAIALISGATGTLCLALIAVDLNETWFFVLLVVGILGSVGLAIGVDRLFEMEQNAIIVVRLLLAAFMGAIGAFVGILLTLIVVLIFFFHEGGKPPGGSFGGKITG